MVKQDCETGEKGNGINETKAMIWWLLCNVSVGLGKRVKDDRKKAKEKDKLR